VTNEEKLRVIKAVLNVEYEPESPAAPAGGSSGGGAAPGGAGARDGGGGSHQMSGAGGSGCVLDRWAEMRQCSTVFELAGQDRSGLLADVLDLLTHNGCDVCTAAVWTYNQRVAFVVSVVEGGAPVRDGGKILRLKQLLLGMMDAGGNGLVEASVVKGLIHYERRLHLLMLKEEEKEWARVRERVLAAAGIPLPPPSAGGGTDGGSANPGPGKAAAANGGGVASPSSIGAAGAGSGAGPHQQQRGGGPEVMCVTSEPSDPPFGAAGSGGLDGDAIPLVSPKYSRPQVTIQHYSHMNYWLVTVRCKGGSRLVTAANCLAYLCPMLAPSSPHPYSSLTPTPPTAQTATSSSLTLSAPSPTSTTTSTTPPSTARARRACSSTTSARASGTFSGTPSRPPSCG
jgi:hypothetical protein